jgi:ankyrin repeat protein
MHAVHWCQVDCARLLLHEGANINIQAPDGSTALHQAVYSSTPNVVDMLLHHQADPHHKDNQGQSPLHWATNNQSIKVLSYLMDKV